MSRRSDQDFRSPSAELPKSKSWRWAFALVILLLLIYLSVAGVVGMWPWARATTTPAPGIESQLLQTVALVILTTFLIFVLNRFTRERLAWNRAPVDVVEFTDRRVRSGPSGSSPPPTNPAWTARFRELLAEAQISTPTAVPGGAGSSAILEVVGPTDTSGWWGAATQLVRAMFPVFSFQVRATAVDGDEAAICVLIVEVSRPPAGVAPIIVREQTWDRAVERAAHEVAALILPRTTHCARPPWTGWRGFKIPEDLFDGYQRARRLQDDRCYDEALATLYQSLRHDPANTNIRLEIGKLYERLGMPLDALAAYDSAMELQRDLHGRPIGGRMRGALAPLSRDFPRTTRGGSRTRPLFRGHDLALVLTRYRHALLLGNADLVHQWQHRTVDGDAAKRTLVQRLHVPDGAGRDQLRVHFCAHSINELEELEQEFPRSWNRSPRARLARQVLSLRSLRLGSVASRLRHARASARISAEEVTDLEHPSAGRWRWTNRRRTRLAALVAEMLEGGDPGWPPSTHQVRGTVRQAMKGWQRALWLDHYNAACVFAETMLEDDAAGGTENEEKASAAIELLRKGVTGIDSGYLAGQRSWLLTGDPDLVPLRPRSSFRLFEDEVFPSALGAPVRGGPVNVWERWNYITSIVRESAGRRRELWSRRIQSWEEEPDDDTKPGMSELGRWWREECEGWRLILRLVDGRDDWRVRAGVIRDSNAWAARYDLTRLSSGFAPYSRESLGRLQGNQVAGTPEEIRQAIERFRRRLADAAEIVSQRGEDDAGGPSPVPDQPRPRPPAMLERQEVAWRKFFADEERALTGGGRNRARQLELWKLCGQRWYWLEQWFDEKDGAQNEFRASVDDRTVDAVPN